MFINFFFRLKEQGLPITIHEWLVLHEALLKNLHDTNLTKFYHMGKAILVKNELYYDKYDIAFLDTFGNIETTDDVLDKILDGLKKVKELKLSEEEKKQIDELDLDEVLKNFEKQLSEEHYKEHVGGNKAIGTGGRSTQGAWGYNPAGIRIGQGESRHNRAIQIAEKREFRNYSGNITLDTRQIRVALSHLRAMLPVSNSDEINIDETIDETCRNGGEIELVWKNREKKTVKVLLLMDVGGSMTSYSVTADRLFSAAKSQISKFKHLYFHNCFYQHLWENIEMNETISTSDFLRAEDDDWKVIIVGDAEMAPSELTWKNGAVDYWYYNDTPGIVWMQRLRHKFKDIIWLNPVNKRSWDYVQSIRMVKDVFPMFELTLEGLDEGIKFLMSGKRV